MLELLQNLLSPSQYMPHGQCYLWQTPLVWLHVTSDALVALAYFSIPAMLFYFVRKRGDIPFSDVFLLFGAFIILCGTGHLLNIWTLWHPAYWVSGVVQALTAIVSCYTALRLVELLPQFLALETPEHLESVNRELEKQIGERQRAEETLRMIVAGTSSATGSDFFPALAQTLATALDVAYVLVCEVTDSSRQCLRSLALWAVDRPGENIEYALAGTPCQEAVVTGALCAYPEHLQVLFPEASLVRELGVESYVGVPLLDAHHEAIGNLCILDVKSFQPDERTQAFLNVFAARAAAELQRKWAEDEKRRAYEELEFRVEERTAELLQTNTTLATEIQERTVAQAKLQQVAQREQATALVIRRMRQSLDLTTIFRATTEELRQAIGCDRTLIYRFKPDWSGQVLAESVAQGWSAIVPIQPGDLGVTRVAVDQADCIIKRLDGTEILIRDTYLQENEGGPYREKTNYCCVTDINQQAFDPCYLELLAFLQARAYVIVPIFCGSQLWGLLATYQNSGPRQWQSSEIQMVMQIGDQLGVAVQQAELFAQTQEQAEQLKQAKELADAANRAKSEFLASMSHELRTPLNVILGLTQLLNRDQTLTPEHQSYLTTISCSGEHLLELINGVLEMSKIEAGRLTFHESVFSLHHLLSSLQDMLSFRASAKGLQLEIETSPPVPQVIKTDEGKLRQILINLLGNAIKFTEHGHITLRVTTLEPTSATNNEQTTILFEVEDTGLGMTPGELQQLFQPFQQTRAGLIATEGTGLGLAISQQYAQLLGGKITAQSQLGQGSVFSVSIPVTVTEMAVPGRQTLVSGTVVGLAPNQPRYRILIAEDNPANRLVMTKLLGSIGFELREATNGYEAIDLWRSWQPHLIFMDIRMPGMDGYAVTRQIRQMEQARQRGEEHLPTPPSPHAPTIIIALTASAFTEQREETLAAGCDDFIRKPFRVQEIFEKMAYHLHLEYRYAVMPSEAQPALQAEYCGSLETHLLQEMPPDWLQRLHRAAVEGNDLQILELTKGIPTTISSVLTQQLKYLAENFQFDKITAAIAELQNH